MIGIVIVLIVLRVIIVVLIHIVCVCPGTFRNGEVSQKGRGVFLEQGGGGGPNHSTNYGTSITIC